jgi:hypothetical protein
MLSRIKIAAVSVALAASLPFGAMAQMNPQPSPRAQVLTAAKYYVASISCIPPDDVVLPDNFIVHLRQTKEAGSTSGEDVWAVLFTNMMSTHPTTSCGGGNGNPPTLIAIVQKEDYGQYYVDPAQSSPVIKFDEPIAQVDNVTSAIPNTLTIEGHNYGPNDGQAQATVPATVTMTVDAAGNWSVVKPLSQ